MPGGTSNKLLRALENFVDGIKEIEDRQGQKRFRVQVSDGVESIFCMMNSGSAPQFENKEMIVGTVISITNYQISPQANAK